MSRPRMAFEAATEFGLSVEDYLKTEHYASGVADGSVVALVDHTSWSEPCDGYDACPGTFNESDPPEKKHPAVETVEVPDGTLNESD